MNNPAYPESSIFARVPKILSSPLKDAGWLEDRARFVLVLAPLGGGKLSFEMAAEVETLVRFFLTQKDAPPTTIDLATAAPSGAFLGCCGLGISSSRDLYVHMLIETAACLRFSTRLRHTRRRSHSGTDKSVARLLLVLTLFNLCMVLALMLSQ